MSQEVTVEDTSYECHHCEAGFEEKTSLIKHMRDMHNAENSTAVNSDDRNQEVKIDLKADPITIESKDTENSINKEDKETSLKMDITTKCRVCEKKLNNARSLKIHMENAHNTFSSKSENPTAVKIEDIPEMVKPERIGVKKHLIEKI